MRKDWNTATFDRKAGTQAFALGKMKTYSTDQGIPFDPEIYLPHHYDYRVLDEIDLKILVLWHGFFAQTAPYDPAVLPQTPFAKKDYYNKLKFYQMQGVPIDL